MEYSLKQKHIILDTARRSIKLHFDKQNIVFPEEWKKEADLWEKRGTFVTLTKKKSLRGCIGSILPQRPLLEDISENAIHAAFHDPRFEPVQSFEIDDITIEASILTTPVVQDYSSPQEMLNIIRPEIDGVIIQNGYKKATFLPQVWEELKDPRDFFMHLCLKAYLPQNFFLTNFNELTIFTYQVVIIKETNQE